jgi:hypothetical protein
MVIGEGILMETSVWCADIAAPAHVAGVRAPNGSQSVLHSNVSEYRQQYRQILR